MSLSRDGKTRFEDDFKPGDQPTFKHVFFRRGKTRDKWLPVGSLFLSANQWIKGDVE